MAAAIAVQGAENAFDPTQHDLLHEDRDGAGDDGTRIDFASPTTVSMFRPWR
jgi:hypothetical protein